MLEIRPCGSAKGTVDYFDDFLLQSDYYCATPGNWHGKGAQRLGLSNEVQRQDFVDLVSNRVPGSGGTKLTVRDQAKRRAAYEFMFSVPKSVSLYFAETGDKTIEQSIQESITETMCDIENAMETRVRMGDQNTNRTTGNMVYASFVHKESRPVNGIADPQFHAHVIAINSTFDEVEGRWKAGEFGNLKANGPFYQAAFNARLAGKLVAADYAIRRTEKDFEIASVSRTLIDKFSKRQAQIEEIAKQKGVTSKAGKAKIALFNRESKSACILPPAAQLAWWRTQMTPAERESLQPASVRGASQNLLEIDAAKALTVEHLFANQSVTRPLHVAAEYLRRGIGSVTVAGAMDFLKDPRLILRHEKVTTAQALSEERAMINTAAKGHYSISKRHPIGNSSLPLPDHLSPEQSRAVRDVLASCSLVTCLYGPAGSGKTTLMQAAVGAIESSRRRDVLVFAPSSSAVSVLKSEGFAKSDTFQRFQADPLLQDVARGQVLWVDEAGFLSVRQMNRLVQFAAKNDCRVILSGDTRQHHAVDRGDGMRLLEESGCVAKAGLHTIIRQRVEELRSAVTDLSRGETAQGFDKLQQAGVVTEVKDSGARYEAIATLHLAARDQGRSSLIVSPTHAECRAIAGAVRSRMKETGTLGDHDHQVTRLAKVNTTTGQRKDPITYRAGQVVEFHRRAPGFKSGERWEVKNDSNGIITVTRNGISKPLPLTHAQTFDLYTREQLPVAVGDTLRVTKNFQAGGKKFRNNELVTVKEISCGKISTTDGRLVETFPASGLHLDQGIAVTSHASQGKTVDQVIVSAPVEAFSQVNQAQFYVSMSRARLAMHLVTDSIAALRQAVCRTSERAPAISITSKGVNQLISKGISQFSHLPTPTSRPGPRFWPGMGHKEREGVGRGR